MTAETCKPTDYSCRIYILQDPKFKKGEEETKLQPYRKFTDSNFAVNHERLAIDTKNCICTCEGKEIRDSEGPSTLLDDSEDRDSKCLQNEWMNCWIEFDFKGKEWDFNGIGIKSANDCPEHDPEKMVISVPKGDGWRAIETFDIDFEHKRWREIKYSIPATRASKLRFDFINSKKDCQQLG